MPTVCADAAGGLGSGPPGPEPPGQPVERVEADAPEGVLQPGERQRGEGGGKSQPLTSVSSFGSGFEFSKAGGRVKSSAVLRRTRQSSLGKRRLEALETAVVPCGNPDDAFSAAAKQIPQAGIRVAW